MKVALDISPLADPNPTGIPMYVESLLRAYLAGDTSIEWTLVGAKGGTSLLEKRGIVPRIPPHFVPACDSRLAVRYPALSEQPAAEWWVRKIDGRLLLPRDQADTARRVGAVDIFHHTAQLRFVHTPARRHIVTIYDLSTRFYPEAHSRINIVEWERVFAFARDRADLIITDSESARQDIVTELGIAVDRVRAIPLGVRSLPADLPPETLAAVRAKFGLTDAPFILAVGSLEPRKNLPRLIEAFAQLVQETSLPDVQLVLTGARLHGATAIDDAITRYGLAERIRLTGYVTDTELAALMQTCACFAYPSLYEGFGLPVIEAMEMGAPVVTSNTSSLPEVVGDAALLVDPTDTSSLAAALHRLLTEDTLATDLRRRGRERAALFTWERTAEAHLQVYREVGN
jgi:glycosyltransferase involved in cell wall biosynthesis